MDTDELSTEAYKGIFIEAERFNHDLTLRFGILSLHCDNEADYLEQAKLLIDDIKKMHRVEIEDIFYGSPPSRKELNKVLDKILANIIAVEKIPEDKRHYEF